MSILGKLNAAKVTENRLNDAKPEEWDGSFRQSCPPSPYTKQIGGSHYKNYKIQPTEYIIANDLNFCQGNIIKYVTRYKDKNGAEDLKKAKHYIDILLAEYDRIEQEERKYEEDNGIY